ncbi:MAG: sigma-70 family RNA polymerase sigma factor [Gemmatimonadales bacterium]|nr:sigma-70 family RNA polymerase sigma factor [Gemmatimonadales bacterium]
MNETELLAGLRRFDEHAQHEAYTRFAPRIFQLAYRMAGVTVLAEDLTQEAMVRVFQRIGQFRGDAKLSTWIHTVAVSVIRNGIRRDRRWAERTVDLEAAHDIGAPPVEGDSETAERLKRVVDALPDDLRLVLIMYDVEGFSHDEIAAALGLTSNASRQRLFRARARLREQLADLAEETA